MHYICRRPVKVCWCTYLPKDAIEIRCTVVVLQHPSEEKQCLRTAPMLKAGLTPGKCIIVKGKKFTPSRKCWDIQGNDTLLLYPGPKAVDIDSLPSVSANGKPYTIILIDGTWPQARSMYHNSPCLHQVQQIKLRPSKRSEYVIKTQPSECCLSTVESGANALSILEENPTINQLLLRPLHALCDFQLQHGAVEHRSKEFKNQNGCKSLLNPSDHQIGT
ncbi:hypothetical protein CHUAL_000443 [Chamberlinius hualienensis]